MRIAFIVDLFPALSETFILNQITGLIDRGHEVDIFSRRRGEESRVQREVVQYGLLDRTHYFANPIPQNKLKRIGKASAFVLKNLRKNFAPLIRSLNILEFGREAASLSIFFRVMPFMGNGPYDIIHCQFGPNGDLGVLLNRVGVLKGKVVTTFHGYDIRLGVEKGGNIYKRLFERGDLFLAISDYNYRNLLDFGLAERKIVQHPVGIDTHYFSFKGNGHKVSLDRGVRIFTVARLVEEKGLRYGIEAIQKVIQKRPEMRLEYCIAGDGPLKGELQNMIDRLDLQHNVRLVGAKDHVQITEEMKKSDIFMLPSVAEALPVVAMEAQAIGLPVIATSVGSVDQIVLDGSSGFCVNPCDSVALADKLLFLIDNPDIWAEMGRKGRMNVEEHFNIDRLNDRLVRLYQGILN